MSGNATHQYKMKKASEQWDKAVIKDRDPDMLHDVVLAEGTGITMHGGLNDGFWDWELYERQWSSGEPLDRLKTDWFDYHDDYQSPIKSCPSLHFRDDRGRLQTKVGVKGDVRLMPSGHHRVWWTDDAGRAHDTSFRLIEHKGKAYQQVVCSCCGVIAEADAIPIMHSEVEIKRWRNKQGARFTAKYTDQWGYERMHAFTFYQAYAYASGKPAKTTTGHTVRMTN